MQTLLIILKFITSLPALFDIYKKLVKSFEEEKQKRAVDELKKAQTDEEIKEATRKLANN